MTKDVDPAFAHRTRTNRREEPLLTARLLSPSLTPNSDTETDANPEDAP